MEFSVAVQGGGLSKLQDLARSHTLALRGFAFPVGSRVLQTVPLSWSELGRPTWHEALDDDVPGLARSCLLLLPGAFRRFFSCSRVPASHRPRRLVTGPGRAGTCRTAGTDNRMGRAIRVGLAGAAVAARIRPGDDGHWAHFYFGPDADQDWVWISPGAVAATILWLFVSLLFKLYIANFTDYEGSYGTVGGVIVAPSLVLRACCGRASNPSIAALSCAAPPWSGSLACPSSRDQTADKPKTLR
jgi:hypothetical protein